MFSGDFNATSYGPFDDHENNSSRLERQIVKCESIEFQ